MANSALPSTTFQGAPGRGYGGTSTTSLMPSLDDFSFETQAGMAYQTGSRFRLTYRANTEVYIEGVIQTYVGTTITAKAKNFRGSGTYDDWSMSIAGDTGLDFIGSLNPGDTFAVTNTGAVDSIPVGANGQVQRVNLALNPPFEYYTPPSTGVTAVTGNSPIASSGGSAPAISIPAGSPSQNGYYPSTDATKLAGIAAGAQVNPSLATQLEAEAGTEATKIMPAVRVKQAVAAQAVTKALADAKGDLFVGTANDTVARLPIGTNGQVLTADSTQTGGMRWDTASGGGGAFSVEDLPDAAARVGQTVWCTNGNHGVGTAAISNGSEWLIPPAGPVVDATPLTPEKSSDMELDTEDPINDDLSVRYVFNEGTGLVLNDLSGNGINGGAGSDSTWADNMLTPVTTVYLPDNPLLSPDSGPFTMFLRFKTGSVGGSARTLYWDYGANGNNVVLVQINSASKINVTVRDEDEHALAIADIAEALADTFYDVAVTRSGTTVSLYKNGTLIDDATGTLGNIDLTGGYVAAIADFAGGSSPLGGQLDSFGFWLRALDSDEIATLHTNPYAGVVNV